MRWCACCFNRCDSVVCGPCTRHELRRPVVDEMTSWHGQTGQLCPLILVGEDIPRRGTLARRERDREHL